jgi:hypothetical protein
LDDFLLHKIALDAMNWVGRTWWELQLCAGWNTSDDPECLTITRSAEGAFQLSGAIKTAGTIELSELEEFYSAEVPREAILTSFDSGQFQGFTAEYFEDGALWRKYWLARDNLMIFATYNGTLSAWERERMEVIAMLRSLRPIQSANTLLA